MPSLQAAPRPPVANWHPLTFACLQSFADALIIIIDDAREGLEEGDRANVAKVLDAANKASITCVIRFHTAS